MTRMTTHRRQTKSAVRKTVVTRIIMFARVFEGLSRQQVLDDEMGISQQEEIATNAPSDVTFDYRNTSVKAVPNSLAPFLWSGAMPIYLHALNIPSLATYIPNRGPCSYLMQRAGDEGHPCLFKSAGAGVATLVAFEPTLKAKMPVVSPSDIQRDEMYEECDTLVWQKSIAPAYAMADIYNITENPKQWTIAASYIPRTAFECCGAEGKVYKYRGTRPPINRRGRRPARQYYLFVQDDIHTVFYNIRGGRLMMTVALFTYEPCIYWTPGRIQAFLGDLIPANAEFLPLRPHVPMEPCRPTIPLFLRRADGPPNEECVVLDEEEQDENQQEEEEQQQQEQ